jgi:hypothetical protein
MSIEIIGADVVMRFPQRLADDIANALASRIVYHADGIRDGTEIAEAAAIITELNQLMEDIQKAVPAVDIMF